MADIAFNQTLTEVLGTLVDPSPSNDVLIPRAFNQALTEVLGTIVDPTPSNDVLVSRAFNQALTEMKGAVSVWAKLPLSVTAVTPAAGLNTGTVNITNLAGGGFDVGAVVKLKLSGQTDITASSVVIVHQAQIQCTFDLTGAAIGKWDVEVTV